MVCLCETEKHIEMCGSIEGFAKKYPIGGIFNNNGIVKGLMTGLNRSFEETLAKYNENLRVPLFGVGDFGTPYLYKYYKNSNIPYINAYSWTPKTLAAFVKAVFGDLPFDGKSSVEL